MIPRITAAVKPLDFVAAGCRPPSPTLSPLSVRGPAARSGRRRSRDTEFIPLRKQVRRAHGYTATMSEIAIQPDMSLTCQNRR
jgi:hypothetical protein